MLKIECGLAVAAVILAFTVPELGAQWFQSVERGFAKLARRRMLSVLAVGLIALALRVALLPIEPIPEPIVHDEFGYLLAADTFAHGRLTNPTHSMWVHFETFSIIQKPTYQCFGQPAQGLLLAAGKVIFGHPFWGAWLTMGIMCATITWALQGWMPARWALLGGLLAVLRLGTFSYWANSYWGGAASAIGGALVLGALPRLKHHRRVRDAVAMGLGLAILANSRPYEGFVFSLPVAGALFFWMLGKQRPPLRESLRRVVAPLCLVLALTAVAMGYYCWRVTGNPFQMPYQVERQTYAVAPYMLWQSPRPQPIYHHEVFRQMYAVNEVHAYMLQRSPIGRMLVLPSKAVRLWSFYLGPILTFPLLVVMFTGRRDSSARRISKRTRFLLLTCGLVLVALAFETFDAPHYVSPLAAVVLGLVLLAMRRLQRWRWSSKPTGLFMTRAVPLICIVMIVLRASAGPLHIPLTENYMPAWYQSGPNSFGRANLLRRLQQVPGRQLVIVRYEPQRDPFEEWVYNDPDIDTAKVVWARDMSPAENSELIQYFRDRRVWLLEPDKTPPRLSQYPSAGLMDRKPEEKTRVSADSQ
jgi:hypothetical protein